MSNQPSASTGPTTAEGKARSSQNARKHGLTSHSLTGFAAAEVNDLYDTLAEEWTPQTETEKLLLLQMAENRWRMNRALALEAAALDNVPLEEKHLALAMRYYTTASRAFAAALASLQKLRKTTNDDARIELAAEQEAHREFLAVLETHAANGFFPPPDAIQQHLAARACAAPSHPEPC